MNTSKKYKLNRSFPHIGQYISWLMQEKHMTQTDVARALGVNPTVIAQYRGQVSVQFGILWALSKAFNHNIFAEMGEKIDVPYETKLEKKLKKEVETLQQELTILRRIVG